MHVSPRKVSIAAAAIFGLACAVPASAPAQVSFVVTIGPAPGCPYGYYGFAPYNCAPYGYYGPQWFTNGFFIGAGPWFRGPRGFYGPVNHDFDPRYGYNGRFPGHDERFDRGRDFRDFHNNDFHGPYGEGHHEGFHGGYEQQHGDHR